MKTGFCIYVISMFTLVLPGCVVGGDFEGVEQGSHSSSSPQGELVILGEVSSGTSSDLDAYRPIYGYSLPPGKSPSDIVGMGIAGSNDHVYVWFDDWTVSSGTSSDLDAYRPIYGYSMPPGKAPSDITGMGIAGSNDHVYAWYR